MFSEFRNICLHLIGIKLWAVPCSIILRIRIWWLIWNYNYYHYIFVFEFCCQSVIKTEHNTKYIHFEVLTNEHGNIVILFYFAIIINIHMISVMHILWKYNNGHSLPLKTLWNSYNYIRICSGIHDKQNHLVGLQIVYCPNKLIMFGDFGVSFMRSVYIFVFPWTTQIKLFNKNVGSFRWLLFIHWRIALNFIGIACVQFLITIYGFFGISIWSCFINLKRILTKILFYLRDNYLGNIHPSIQKIKYKLTVFGSAWKSFQRHQIHSCLWFHLPKQIQFSHLQTIANANRNKKKLGFMWYSIKYLS